MEIVSGILVDNRHLRIRSGSGEKSLTGSLEIHGWYLNL